MINFLKLTSCIHLVDWLYLRVGSLTNLFLCLMNTNPTIKAINQGCKNKKSNGAKTIFKLKKVPIK